MLNRSFNVSFVVGPSVEFNEEISMWLRNKRGRPSDLFVHGHRAIKFHYDDWLDRNSSGCFNDMLEDDNEVVAAVSRTINNFQPVLKYKQKRRPTVVINCFPATPQQTTYFMRRWRNAKVVGVHFVHDPHNHEDATWFEENELLCDALRALAPHNVHYYVIQRAADKQCQEVIVSTFEEPSSALAVA